MTSDNERALEALDATVEATKRRDYRAGLAEDLRKRLSDLEYAMLQTAIGEKS